MTEPSNYLSLKTNSEARVKMQMYAANMLVFDRTFTTFGTQRFVGKNDAELREMAVNSLIEIRKYMSTDRLIISDHFAVIPNYYARLENAEDCEEDPQSWAGRGENPVYLAPDADVRLVYTVGFELVQRDFRNYAAMPHTHMIKASNRYIIHPALRDDPPVQPNANARSFDIPIGVISKARFDTRNRDLELTVKGFNGETLEFKLGTAVTISELRAMLDLVLYDSSAEGLSTRVESRLASLRRLTEPK